MYWIIAAISLIFQTKQTEVNLSVTGFKNNGGVLVVDIFNSPEHYPSDREHAYKRYTFALKDNRCNVTFSLPEGTYAFSLFHDEDENGKVNTNWLGMPKEGVGASNNAKGFMGPPDFENAKFKVGSETVFQKIRLNYL